MKTKKIVSTVLTAALLIFALLVSSCMDLAEELSGNGNDEGEDYQVTPGRGIVKFIISDGRARTILPNASISDMYFRVTFVDRAPSDAEPDQFFPKVAAGAANSAQKLSSGKFNCKVLDGLYDVTIQAYNSSTADPANLITAWGPGSDGYISTGYPVSSSTTTISAALKGEMTPSGKGIFKYAVTLPDEPEGINTESGFAYTAQTLDVYTFGTTTPKISQIDLSDNASDSVQIGSGVYKVVITLQAGNCEDRVLTSVMHIWDGLTSTYTETNLPAPNQNKFTVKFDKNGGLTGDSVSTLINNGGTVTKPVTDPTHSTEVFDAWYTAAVGGALWDFTPGTGNKVYRDDITLYAHWNPAAGTDMVITIGFDDSIGDEHAEFEDPTAVFMSVDGTTPVASITYDQLADAGGAACIKITLTSDLADNTNLGTWVVQKATDIDISSSVAWNGSKAVLTINKSNVATILGSGAAGDYTIGVEIDDGVNVENTYSAKIVINVTRQ